MSDESMPTPTAGAPRPTPSRRRPATPNYAARRMLVTTVAIVAIVAFGVVGWMVVRGDDDTFGGSSASWDRIAAVDRSSGSITFLDADGEVERTVVGQGRVSELHTIDDRVALIGTTQIVIESTDADWEPITVPISRTAVVTPVHTDGGLDLIVGEPTGGNVLIIDVVTGEQLDIGALARATEPQPFGAPLLFAETVRWSADANEFAVADASSFQTIVVRKGSPEASFFRAQPVALSAERVVTSQIVGGQADVEIYDNDRESQARVPVPIPAGGVMRDGTLLMVAIDGGVYRVGDGDTEAQRLGEVAVPPGGSVASVRTVADGERLVVSGGAFEAVIDDDGRVLFHTTFTEPVEPMPVAPDWACVPVGGDDSFHSLRAADDGTQLADLTDFVVSGAAADGCTVVGERGGIAEVVDAAGVVSLGAVRSVHLGPDGRSIVRTTTTGDTHLLRLDDDRVVADPIDLTERVPRNPLIAFLQTD